ncbi:iron export ABC transporter permease subunit FetB [bacterium]|nr:iron export ABC transporter permease subunit FetB [bacterium]
MNPDYMTITMTQVWISASLVLLAIFLMRLNRTKLEGTFLVGAIRTFIQLWLVGYVLLWLFDTQSGFIYACVVEFMICVGSYTAGKRQDDFSYRMFISLWLSLHAMVLIVGGFLFTAVLQTNPIQSPHLFIPLMGMLIGNSANGAALSVHRLRSDIQHRRGEIEAALALGAPPKVAVQPFVSDTLRNALIPTVNSMMLMGIVQLPGILSGQLISGIVPEEAIRYQIIVVYMIAGATSLACHLTVWLESRRLFNKQWALCLD